MTKNLSRWAAGALGAAALLVSSCAYDPSYSSAGVSYGYGDGYGYGNSSFSTSIFVSTGDPRWGYDPYSYSYYDYHRHAYYDPYLYGYYPVGFRPYAVYGVPHPGGWRPGRGYCPPPSRVSSRNLSNYRNRESAYRGSNYSWANQVRSRDTGSPVRNDSRQNFDRSRGNDSRSPGSDRSSQGSRDFRPNNGGFQPNNGGFNRGDDRSRYGNDNRSASPSRTSYGNDPSRSPRSGYNSSENRPQFQPSSRPQRDSGQGSRSQGQRGYSPSGYNSPVGVRPERAPQQQQPRVAPEVRAPQPQAQPQPSPRSAPSGDGRRSSPGHSRGDGNSSQFR